jgi:hypothetical protein
MTFFQKCLRTIRAFNFDNKLVTQCQAYYEYLYVSTYVVDRQVLNMRYFFTTAIQKLRLKSKLDPNLVGNEQFQVALGNFEALHKVV